MRHKLGSRKSNESFARKIWDLHNERYSVRVRVLSKTDRTKVGRWRSFRSCRQRYLPRRMNRMLSLLIFQLIAVTIRLYRNRPGHMNDSLGILRNPTQGGNGFRRNVDSIPMIAA